MTDAKMKNLGRIALFSAAFLWGVSFILMKNVLANVQPLYIIAIRFCGAALILLPACAGKLRSIDRGYFTGGILMGLALLIAYVFQTYGLTLTTPGKNAFLTSVYCIIVPFLYWALIKKRPDRFNAAAAAICIIGVGLISLEGDLSIGAGDALTIVCGFFFALHIVITARYVTGRNPVLLAMLQFAAAGVLALLGALMLESPPAGLPAADLWTLLFLTGVSTAGCLLMQVFGQKYSPPSQAAVIMTFESVFGALASVVLLYEVMTFRLAAGFTLTFAAVIISETKLGFIRNNG